MSTEVATTTLGGSASSQADTLNRAAWSPRPSASLTIRLAVVVTPIVTSIVAVWTFASLVPAPPDWFGYWTWIAGLVAVSCAASFAVQRALRALAPLELLFKMSLIFPDEAPTRFGLALRTGTFRSLARRVRRSDDGQVWTMQRWAEHLVAAMDRLNRHDRLTAGHSERVRAYSVMLGQEIGLPPEELDRLNWAALVHDVGKLDVDAEILSKPDRPTPQEWAVLRNHPGAGWRYVDPLRPWLGGWVDAATQHHERWDGTGYPLGLAGEDISLAGRIVAIADAFDVMTAARSYKKPLPAAQARAELTRNSGTQFDPQLVRSFLQISLGRMRRVIGPLGVLAHFPDFLRVPLTAALSSTTAVVTAGAIAVGAAAGAAAPREPDARNDVEASVVADDEREAYPEIIALDERAASPADTTSPESPPPATAASTDETPAPTPTTAPTSPAASATAPMTAPMSTAAPVVGPANASTSAPAALPSSTAATLPQQPASTAPPMPTTVPAPAPVVTSPGDGPPAWNDTAATGMNQKVSVHVLVNDTFAGGVIDIGTLVIAFEAVHGTVKIAGENLLYQPPKGFVGTDTMGYRVCSTAGECDAATVTIVVG